MRRFVFAAWSTAMITASPAARRVRFIPRRGLSLVEFVGCFSALAGGVVLGSMYLGVDPKQAAVGLLRSSGLLEEHTVDVKTNADAFVVSSDSPLPTTGDAQAASSADSPTAPSTTAATQPTENIPQAFAGPAAPIANALMTPEDTKPITDAERKAFTEAYWLALDQTMRREVDQRLSSIRDSANWQLFDYLRGRQLGHQEAAAAIGKLDKRGVDDHVLAYAKRAQKWHEDGGRLFERALDLLTDAPSGKLSGPFAQSWQSAATQHRMEARLLEEKHAAVKSYLAHQRETATVDAAAAN